MNTAQVDALLHFLKSAVSRRGLLSGLTGGALTTAIVRFGADDAGARKKGKGKKKRKNKNNKAKTRTDATCLGAAADEGLVGLGVGNNRIAQTFTALSSGPLVRADLRISKAETTSGDYIVQIGTVDNFGTPTNEVLAVASVPSGGVPDGSSTVSFSFNRPLSVVAGTQYALILTQPGSNFLGWTGHFGDPCAGRRFVSLNQTSPFQAGDNGLDLEFTTFVKS
jgi:hypothetical protein